MAMESKTDLPDVKVISQSFDFETAGADYNQHPSVALGIDTFDGRGQLTHMELVRGLCPSADARMEPRCKREFWDKFPEIQKRLAVDDVVRTPLTLVDTLVTGDATVVTATDGSAMGVVDVDFYEREMARQFVARTIANEKKAKEIGAEFVIVVDTAAFDVMRIQHLLAKHSSMLLTEFPDLQEAAKGELTAWPQLPYSFVTPFKYGWCKVVNIADLMDGIVAAVQDDPHFPKQQKKPSAWEVIQAVYDLPKTPESYEHDHSPEHDAYLPGWQYYCYELIRQGLCPKRSSVVEPSRKRKLEELQSRLAATAMATAPLGGSNVSVESGPVSE
jgi:hypothetical protein